MYRFAPKKETLAIFPEVLPNKRMPIVIGICGKAGSGKDTIGRWLQNNHGFEILQFATPIKNATSQLFDININNFYSTELKEKIDPRWNKSPRELMQWLGTDVMRKQVDINFFVKHMQYRLNDIVNIKNRNVVITDVRFDNEAKLILDQPEGSIWHVNADYRLSLCNPLQGETRYHETEKGISSHLISRIIENNTSRPALYERLEEIYPLN